MLAFLVVSSIWWWVLSGAFVISLIWGSLKENGYIIFFDILIYLALLEIAFDSPVLKVITDNPLNTFLCFIGYFVIGTVWSFFKWYLTVNKYVNDYNDNKTEFRKNLNSANDKTISEKEFDERWQRYPHKPRRPHAKNEKSTISYWIGYWPISVVFFFFEDFFKKIIEHIMNVFRGVYTKIEEKQYSKLD